MTSISVVIPAFRPRDFAVLIRTMAANRDVNAEWIVVDDGSGPEFDAVFATLPEFVIVLRRVVNSGPGAARNFGLQRARGNWIKFLDADDELSEGHLGILLGAACAENSNAIPFASTRHVFVDGNTLDNKSWRGLNFTPEDQLSRLLRAPFLHHCGALFRRTLLEQLGGYDAELQTDEDGDLLIRILLAGNFFVPVEGAYYLYIHHNNGNRVSADVGYAKLESRLRVCDRVEAAFAHSDKTMPKGVRLGLALRLDKIALSYWQEDRLTSNAVIEKARIVCPDYHAHIRWQLRILRAVGGPSAVVITTRFYRWLRGRPKGGAQG